jgi:chemotaxis signal transduction protein
VRACVFAFGGEHLAADIRHTREVVVLPDRTPVPRAPTHILGVANLRGSIVPIVDVSPLLGLPLRPASEGLRMIVLEDAGVQIAIPTDEVLGLEAFEGVLPADTATPGPFAELAVGLLKRGDETATLLDVPKLIESVRAGPPSRLDA